MAKKIIIIHGRSFKPPVERLRDSWIGALSHGVERDFPADGQAKLSKASIDLAYYGNLSNEFLRNAGKTYDSEQDSLDREKCLSKLMEYKKEDFLLERGKDNYSNLPGKTALKEFAADVLSVPAHLFRLQETIVKSVAPDMRQYWNVDSEFGSSVRWTLTEPMVKALKAGDDVLLIAHSLGTMIAFDVLWKFSYYGEYRELRESIKPLHWITLGSPLGDELVKDKLKGASARGVRKYPKIVDRWDNIAAEDDYISHDQTIADDFSDMVEANLTSSIVDRRIYNLAVRHGDSNPHHGAGYLIHPTVSKIVYDWLG